MCSLSYVHVYRIEYVSYRQGPYRIRIVSAADRIVQALVNNYKTLYTWRVVCSSVQHKHVNVCMLYIAVPMTGY